MQEACKLVCRLYVKRQVQSHVVRNTVCVAVGVVRHVLLVARIIIPTSRHCGWSACGIVKVAREAVSLCNLIVQHSLHVVRSVVFRWIPLSVVQRHSHALVVLLQLRARECVAHPSVQLSKWLLGLQLYSVCSALCCDNVGLKVWVHQQHGTTAVVQIVANVLVVNLGRELILLVGRFVIDTSCGLPSVLWLDVQVRQLPHVGRRHD